MLSPQSDGTILVHFLILLQMLRSCNSVYTVCFGLQAHFDFNYEVTDPQDVIPVKIKTLLAHQPVQELHLAFVLGRWVCHCCMLFIQLSSMQHACSCDVGSSLQTDGALLP